MLYGTVPLTDYEGVTLTSYVHEPSEYMRNVAKRPAVLVIPGGGYDHVSEREGEPVAMAFAGAGYHAFLLKYSVGDHATWPVPQMEADLAMAHIVENADYWGVDTERIAVIGFSAGGHLALSLATHGQLRPAATMLIYPVVTRETLAVCDPAVAPAPDMLMSITAATAPTFIAHTGNDQLVPVTDSLALAQALTENEVSVELHIFPEGVHGLSLGTVFTSSGVPEKINPTFAQWFDLAVDWLGRQFPME